MYKQLALTWRPASDAGWAPTGGRVAPAAAPTAAAQRLLLPGPPTLPGPRGPPCGRGGWTRLRSRRARTSCAAMGQGRWGRPGALQSKGGMHLGGEQGSSSSCGGGRGCVSSRASSRAKAWGSLSQRARRGRRRGAWRRSPVLTPGSRPAHVCFWPTLFRPLASRDTTFLLPRALPSPAAAAAAGSYKPLGMACGRVPLSSTSGLLPLPLLLVEGGWALLAAADDLASDLANEGRPSGGAAKPVNGVPGEG